MTHAQPTRNLLTPKLLAVVLGLDAFLYFFAAMASFGLDRLPPLAAFGGGAAAIAACVLAAGLVRRTVWGVVLGWVLQVGLVALGFVLAPMFVIGAGFLLLWVWCLWRGAKADRAPLEGAA